MAKAQLRKAEPQELDLLLSWDRHVCRQELERSIGLGRTYLVLEEGRFVGWMRYNLFWDEHPFLNMLFLLEEARGKGYGRQLMEYCIADARESGRSGVCMLGADKQKAWLSDQAFAKKYGFQAVDSAAGGYELLALSFDGTLPRFAPNAKRQQIDSREFTVYYSPQCPYIHQSVELVKKTCAELGVPVNLIEVDSLEKAKALPCVFNNWAMFYGGKFVSVNLPDAAALKRVLGTAK